MLGGRDMLVASTSSQEDFGLTLPLSDSQSCSSLGSFELWESAPNLSTSDPASLLPPEGTRGSPGSHGPGAPRTMEVRIPQLERLWQ